MNENPDMPEEQKAKYLGITLEKAYRLEELLSEFFDITRMNVQSMVISHVKVDLTMMLYQIADEFYPVLAEKRLTAVLDVESGLKVSGDADKLARVFDNLLRNAAAYSYPNTCVCIEAAGRRMGSMYVSRIRVMKSRRRSLRLSSRSFTGWTVPGEPEPAVPVWGWPLRRRLWSCTAAGSL